MRYLMFATALMASALGATSVLADDERTSGSLVEKLDTTAWAAAVPLSVSELAYIRGRGNRLFVGNLPFVDVPDQMGTALQKTFPDGVIVSGVGSKGIIVRIGDEVS